MGARLTHHGCGMLRQIVQASDGLLPCFRVPQKLWDDPHLTVCGWHSGGLIGGSVSANRSDSLSAEDEERKKRRQGRGSRGRKAVAQCLLQPQNSF